jgi:hypothetical protein
MSSLSGEPLFQIFAISMEKAKIYLIYQIGQAVIFLFLPDEQVFINSGIFGFFSGIRICTG